MPSAHASHAAMHSGPGRRSAGAWAAAQRTRSRARRTRRWSGRTLVWPSSSRPRKLGHVVVLAVGELAPHQLVDGLPGLRRPRRRRHRVIVRELPDLRPERELQHHGIADGGPIGQVQEPGQPQRRQLGRLADEQRLDEGDRVGRRGRAARTAPRCARGRRTPRAPPGARRRSPRRRAGSRPASAGDAEAWTSAGNRLAAGLSSIAASGCPEAGVSGSSSDPQPSAARQSASRTPNPACPARRTSSDRRPRSGMPRAAANVVSV